MDGTIRAGIAAQKCLEFTYKGTKRKIEPHTYGLHRSGADALCGWQIAGGSGEGFRVFLLSDISGLSLDTDFDCPRPGFKRGDTQFRTIYCEL